MPISGCSWRIWWAASRPSVLWDGRHADVDHHQLGRLLGDQGQELGGVAGLADDLEAGTLEQAGQPLAEQHVVLGQDHPQLGRRRHGGDYGLACGCEHAADPSAPAW
jgi:hypothetical protein